MPYNSATHHRRSIRLKGYDYWQAGAYFITICCQDRKHRFGAIESGQMQLNDFGTIAHNEWNKLSERFSNFEVDVFQIMPNHMHGIIVLNVGGGGVGAGLARAPELNASTIPTPPLHPLARSQAHTNQSLQMHVCKYSNQNMWGSGLTRRGSG